MVSATRHQRPMYSFCNRFRLVQHVMIPEPQDDEITFPKERVARRIGGRMRMLPSIHFHHDFPFQADAIKNAMVIGMLPAELAIVELTAAKHAPEVAFGVGHAVAQPALQLRLEDGVVGLSSHSLVPC